MVGSFLGPNPPGLSLQEGAAAPANSLNYLKSRKFLPPEKIRTLRG
jgi:hypothetical protein